MDYPLVGEMVDRITGMGVVVAIEQDEDYWFVSILNKNYELTGIAESSNVLLSALERAEHRLVTEK